jgi:NADH pyrophosphatase NudC (nudix superfamily)
MNKLEKIDKETDNGVFDLLFKDENYAIYAGKLSLMVKELVKHHNELVDVVNSLIVSAIDGSEELIICPKCGDNKFSSEGQNKQCNNCGTLF